MPDQDTPNPFRIEIVGFRTVKKTINGKKTTADLVTYCRPGEAAKSATEAHVATLDPSKLDRENEDIDQEDLSNKIRQMEALWAHIGPAYKAWKGEENKRLKEEERNKADMAELAELRKKAAAAEGAAA